MSSLFSATSWIELVKIKEGMMKKKMEQYFWVIFLLFGLPMLTLSWQNIVYLDLSSNQLEGPLPTSICNSSRLAILVLANNNFSGELPSCLGNFTDLVALDLRNNTFHGEMPKHFSKNYNLKNIALNGNNLEGPLPRSITNCSNLEVIDVGNNKLTDTFPTWLSDLPQLHVLILRSNRFYGTINPTSTSISKTNTVFPKLRILDASHNNFAGTIPYGFFDNSLPAMVYVRDDEVVNRKYMGDGDGSSYYLDSITLVMKGFETEIHRVLSVYSTIDLSVNKFEGEVPESVGNLHALKQLNLSHNSFTGSIPRAFGKLGSSLESLDLSSNKFTGKIPRELGELTSLGKFDVSENQLWGQIPPFRQPFSNESFVGNHLCGLPLKDCPHRNPMASTDDDDLMIPSSTADELLDIEHGFTWKSVAMGYGFGMIIGLLSGSLMLSIGQPKWVLKIIEDVQQKMNRRKKRRRRYVSIRSWH